MGSRPAEPPPLTKKSPAKAVVQARIVAQVLEIHRLDPLVRRNAADAVHQMRVASRRLRSALATFRPVLDREVTDPLRDELRWLGRTLGDARDAEVMRERMRDLVEAQPAEVLRGGAPQRIDAELAARYDEAHSKAMAAMDSQRYVDLLERLDALAARPPWTAAADKRAVRVLPEHVRRDWKRLVRRQRAAVATSDPAERAVRLHETRKAAKRVRYAAESMVPLYGKDARRLVKGTKQVQSLLGEHQDSVVTRQWLIDLADKAAAEGDDSFTLGVLHAREEQIAETAEARLEKTWRTAAKKKRRRWLSQTSD
ncbi:MAG TPA: CHAD domain-containing protein [Nocardioidaceae bacterium]|nr:CHAD domain-containing protein [Nocardioidaceae bacterium]